MYMPPSPSVISAYITLIFPTVFLPCDNHMAFSYKNDGGRSNSAAVKLMCYCAFLFCYIFAKAVENSGDLSACGVAHRV